MFTVLQQIDVETASVVHNALSSLVQVHSAGGGAGSGSIWHPEGLVVTNAHVASREPLHITLPDGRTLPARILARDAGLDLAVLAVDAPPLPAIDIGDSKLLQPGHWVLALGHPWGIRGGVTAGVVIGSTMQWPGPRGQDREWVVVSLHLRPGHSGGPLLDAQGRLVGINTMVTGPDVGFAVPVHVVKRFLRKAFGLQDEAA